MNKRILMGIVLAWGLTLVSEAIPQAQAQSGTTKNYGNVTLSSNGAVVSGHFPDVWDLTAGDLEISFTYDATGLEDEYGGLVAHAIAQLGVRAYGYSDFNPTSDDEGAGVWLVTDYDWDADTFDPDDPDPILDLDDKLILQKAGGHSEGNYNLPSPPPNPGDNHRIWFDRDGVDPWQVLNPSAVDGGTYNTNGRYEVIITLHATSGTSGTVYMTVNGLGQGFETDNDWGSIELSPAGMTFTGDMTQMQVFYGLYSFGETAVTQTVVFEDITVTVKDTAPDGYHFTYLPLAARNVSTR